MTQGLTIAAIVLAGLIFAWLMHQRTSRRLNAILERLASEKNGVVRPGMFGGMPKLMLSHRGKPMEISAASTGTSSDSSAYTYVLFHDIEPAGCSFRILPKSAQTVIDNVLGLKKAVVSGDRYLDKYFSICTTNQDAIRTLLAGPVQSVIVSWVTPDRNLIRDVRNYDDKLIFCVDGTLTDYSEFQRMIDSACIVFDALERVRWSSESGPHGDSPN